MTTTSSDQTIRYGSNQEAERPLGRSVKRGMMNTCPACGSGKLFKSFLKPVDNCAACARPCTIIARTTYRLTLQSW